MRGTTPRSPFHDAAQLAVLNPVPGSFVQLKALSTARARCREVSMSIRRSAVGSFLAAMFVMALVPAFGALGRSGSSGVAHAAGPYSIWPGTVTPGMIYNNPAAIEVGLKFRSDIAGYVTGVRFYKPLGATGTHVGRLWAMDQSKLAEVAFTGETASGWQTAEFPAPVAIQAGTTYIISYASGNDGNRRIALTQNTFVSAGVDNAPLHALMSGVDGPNGVYSDNGSWFGQNYLTTNYWVDVIFDDTPPPADVTPPTVGSVVPADSASGVLISSSVSVIFSEAMAAASIDGATFELRDASGDPVAASVTCAAGSYKATLEPTSDLDYNTIYSAHVKGDSSGVKDLAGNALAADYMWTFTTETPDLTPPTVSSVMPVDGVTRLRRATRATARFSEAMDAGTINATTFELRDALDNQVPASVTFDAGTLSATLDPDFDLACNTTYTARVKGGTDGVKDAFGNALAADYTWSFGIVAERPPVDQAPGGPILVIASSANLYTRYFTEILRTEGLNEFGLADIAQVTSEMLAAHDVVILGDLTLSAGQVSLLATWVNDGGHLIAMRPDKQLAGLLGLADAASTLSNGYLLIDTSRKPGTGIVGQTLQFHGTADAYALDGATAIATLYSDRTTATAYPAVTMRSVGTNGGAACAFTFDLARSIVYTHQGNPAWQSGHVNPLQTYGTALDLFYPDWIDFNRITIPQADEQQRFLANLIIHTNADRKPLPRFWYLPKGKKAAIILTGDDHWGRSSPSGSSKVFFDRHQAQSPVGCSEGDWECVRSSSYGYEGCLLTDAEAAAYTAQGFEFGLHADAGLASGGGWCGTWPADTREQYGAQFETLMRKYASLPVQGSERDHCYSWFGYAGPAGWQGYAGIPEVEEDLGIRFDTNISYNPGSWASVNPGYQMGSGMMMRFAQVDTSGVMTRFLDIYNGGTQMNDDNGQGAAAMRTIVDAFLDNATGTAGYYGGFVVNMHSDNWYGWSYAGSDQVVASAQARGIPVVSGTQMADWLDGRNSSSFGSIGWDGTTLAFTVAVGEGARNLMGMLPRRSGAVPLSALTRDGSDVPCTFETIKGVEYAFFPAIAGTYAATYAPDLTPPVISAVTVSPGLGQTATVAWTTNEAATGRLDYGTASGSLATGTTAAALVTAHSFQLSGLLARTTYYYRVVSVDESGNTAVFPATGSEPASFTTPSATFNDITFADFSAGSPDAGLYIGQLSDGEVILAPAAATEFSGTSLPPGWAVLEGTGTATVSGGVLTLNGSTVGTAATYSAGHSVEVVATFTAGIWQHAGFGVTYQTDSGQAWAMISTGATGLGLSARCWTGSGAFDTQSTPIPGSFFGVPHRYRVDWNANSIDYYVDGVKVATHEVTITTPMRPLVSVGGTGSASLTVDRVYLTPYAGSGVFTSRVFDARGPATWQGLSWTSDVPAGTTLAMSARTGDAPGEWTTFMPIANSGGAIGGTSRYVQYQATLGTGDPAVTPMLRDVSIGYAQDEVPPPLISAISVDPIGGQTATVNWATDVPATSRVDYGTSAGSLGMSVLNSTLVEQHAINLTGLLPATQYYYRVTSADGAGAATTEPVTGTDPATFTTLALSFMDMTVPDFSAGSPDANLYISQMADGEVTLNPTVATEFSGSNLPSGWSKSGTGTATVGNGVIVLNGATVGPDGIYSAGHSVEAVATFTAGIHQHIGFGVTLTAAAGDAWAIISTGAAGTGLLARCWTGSGAYDTQSTPIQGSYLGAPHRYRVDWNTDSVDYYVDGVKVATHGVTITTPMRPLASVGPVGAPSLTVDWLRMSPYPTPGVFNSRIFDADTLVDWQGMSWTSDVPDGTALTMSARTGNLPVPDETWTQFAPVATSGSAIGGASRYVQYQATLSTSDPALAPTLRDVQILYAAVPQPVTALPPQLPAKTWFSAPAPNPFGRTTTLSFALARGGVVELGVYGIDGRRVAILVAEIREPGQYHVKWDGRDSGGQALRPGVYYARLMTPEGRFTRTLVLTR